MTENKTRLDVYLVTTKGFSREYTRELIKSGLVLVNGKPALKPGRFVAETDDIKTEPVEMKYVGRGGYKLEKALEHFGIDLNGLCCADIGASTGGFTDCMLQNGAKKVYAIENGNGQLAQKLLSDSGVVSMEDTDIRTVFSLEPPPEFISVDLSFISVTKVVKNIASLLSENGSAVILIKPQFETGTGLTGKSGVVKDLKLHRKICTNIICEFENNGLFAAGLIPSPIKGKSGNTEYLLYCTKARQPGICADSLIRRLNPAV